MGRVGIDRAIEARERLLVPADRVIGLGSTADRPGVVRVEFDTAVEVRYRNGGASVEMQLGDNWRVNLDDALIQSLNEWLRPENVEVVYA